jgi:hypothetical protein
MQGDVGDRIVQLLGIVPDQPTRKSGFIELRLGTRKWLFPGQGVVRERSGRSMLSFISSFVRSGSIRIRSRQPMEGLVRVPPRDLYYHPTNIHLIIGERWPT